MAAIDEAKLEAFREGLRRRYSDEEILAELRASADRLGRSPTMREFGADPETNVHPRTVVERFGSWNDAKRAAGLVPRRFATRDDLITQLRELGGELGRVPTASDLQAKRGAMPSKSLYWHVFGSLANALREAGFDVPDEEARVDTAVEEGARLARKLGKLPTFANWAAARREDPAMPSEWQVYRLVAERGRWSGFQFLVRERLVAAGLDVAPDGRVRSSTARRRAPRSRRGARDTRRAPRGPAQKGGAAP